MTLWFLLGMYAWHGQASYKPYFIIKRKNAMVKLHADENELKWKTLSSEYLFNDVWLRARKDRCEKPDGNIVDPYYVVEYPQWATGVGITENNEVVLVKQYRHALQVVCMEIPGGCIDAEDQIS